MKMKFGQMFDQLKKDGAKIGKLKLRYYTEDFRGVHAAAPIKNGDTIIFIPHD